MCLCVNTYKHNYTRKHTNARTHVDTKILIQLDTHKFQNYELCTIRRRQGSNYKVGPMKLDGNSKCKMGTRAPKRELKQNSGTLRHRQKHRLTTRTTVITRTQLDPHKI